MADPKNAPNTTAHSKEEIDAALELMRKTKEQRAKQRERFKADPDAKARFAAQGKKRRVHGRLLIEKAIKAGITVTEAEIAAELKKTGE